MNNRERLQYSITFIVDALALLFSVGLTWLVFRRGLGLILPTYTHNDLIQFHLIVVIAFLAAYLMRNQAELMGRTGPGQVLWRTVQYDFVFTAALAILMLVTKNPLVDSRYLFVGVVGGNLIFAFLGRLALPRALRAVFTSGRHRLGSLVGIVTTSARAEPLIRELKKDWTKQLHGVALLDALPGELGRTVAGVPVTAGYEDYIEWVRRAALDELYIDIPYESGESLMPCLQELESMGLNIHINVPVLERMQKTCDGWAPRLGSSLENLGGRPLVTINAVHHSPTDLFLKRLMDIVGSLVGCLISIPIIAVVAIPLKLESPGPLLFKQKRVGKNGRIFQIYKLRSMYADAEKRKTELQSRNEMNGLMFKMADDPRVTKVGRFIRRTSIDELPQFFNVLRGDMSLVGTRPPTLDEYERYESHHKRRLSMKPGITGMWQVSGRSTIEDFEEVVRLDVQYIDNWSLGLDIKLLLQTVVVVFTGHGAE